MLNDRIVRPYMPELDALRGCAALMVMFYHLLFWSVPPAGLSRPVALLRRLCQPGWTGVELFFVLSGFLIGGILIETRARPDYYRRFYLKRVFRILPIYLLTVASASAMLGVDGGFIAMCLTMSANLAPLVGVPMIYGPLWSLAVEEHFYLTWPFLVRRVKPERLGALSLTILIASPVLRLAGFHWLRGEGVFSYTWYSLDGLAFGAMIAAHVRRPGVTAVVFGRHWRRGLVAVLALTVLTLPFGVMSRDTGVGTALQRTCLTCWGGVALAGALLLGVSGRHRWLEAPVFGFFSRISYSLYMIHVLILGAYERWLGARIRASGLGVDGGLLLRAAIVSGVSVVLSLLLFHALEAPMIKLGARVTQRGTIRTEP